MRRRPVVTDLSNLFKEEDICQIQVRVKMTTYYTIVPTWDKSTPQLAITKIRGAGSWRLGGTLVLVLVLVSVLCFFFTLVGLCVWCVVCGNTPLCLHVVHIRLLALGCVIGHGILAGIYLAKCRDSPSSQSLMCETKASHHGSFTFSSKKKASARSKYVLRRPHTIR